MVFCFFKTKQILESEIDKTSKMWFDDVIMILMAKFYEAGFNVNMR